ncbi:hypothetical protein DFH08DRAFT_1089363 [Mycena albidolilacea]|uniref:Uncharacterized protein n=1 Tax=Mycena albidolilacea TaxID=1033008 RepID=A0AAD7E8Y4_9AGAR|nr:hypothetical protein DFH08DRAFT_1089363 [Mycena albidolilacea]
MLVGVPPALALLPPALLRGSCARPSCARFRLARPATGALLAHLISRASRVRLLLTELKKRIAALIARRRRHPATTTLLAATRFSRLTSARGAVRARSRSSLGLLLHLRLSSPVPSTSSSASPPASESPCSSASSSASELSHARPPSPITSTFSDSTCTIEEHPYFVLAADAPFPYDGAGSDRGAIVQNAGLDARAPLPSVFHLAGVVRPTAHINAVPSRRPFLTLFARVCAYVLSSILPHLRPTARTFPIATSPKDWSRRGLPWRPSSPLSLQLPRSATIIARSLSWRPHFTTHSISFPPSGSSSLTRAPHCAHLPHRPLLQGQGQVPQSSFPVPELAVRAPADPERDERDK